MSAWTILAPALAVCLLMLIAHTYLGLHVLARGIIFVDLALAQIAVLGVSLAFLAGYDTHSVHAHAFAFGSALIAGGGFALLRRIPNKVTREVAIGCAYVVATALTVVILSRSTQGVEELKGMLNGNILFVRWSEVAVLATAYALLALLHSVFFRRFYALSFTPEPGGRRVFLWEFLFFASFALVITLGVDLAGVLLVFAYLIIPAFSASLLTSAFRRRLPIGVLLGLAGSVAGLWLSYLADLPTGPTVVTVLGLLPVAAALAQPLLRRVGRKRMA